MSKLELTNVTKVYANGAGVRNVTLTVEQGELVSLLGPSGCGKTTLLRIIGGFITPEEGDIRIDGVSVKHLPPEKRPTAMVFQQYNLWPHMSVYENLAFGLKLRRIDRAEIRRRVLEVLELVQLAELAEHSPSELSGGQQQRVALARALVLRPKVLLLDEPFSNLDARLRLSLREELRRIQKETKTTMVFVTHDQEEALYLSDRIAVMHRGRIEQVDNPTALYDHPKSLFVAQFIGEMNCLSMEPSSPVWTELVGPSAETRRVCAVRPEHVVLTREPTPVRGRVIGRVLAGHFVKLQLETNVGRLIAYETREGGDAWLNEEDVYIRFQKTVVFEETHPDTVDVH